MTTNRAVAYARFSSDNQREESIDAQVRAIELFCEQRGIKLMKTYIDRAKSATSDKRPAFQEMITDSEKHLFEIVIVHKLDRFSRDKYDSAKYKHKLKKNGVRVMSVTENLDGSPESIILESVIEGMAEYYSKNLAREVMKGLKETALKCQHTGGFPPIGYSVDPVTKKYVINESEREIVEIVFDMYLDGKGYDQIVKALAERNFKSRYGKAIGKSHIPTILNNEKYIGTYIFNLTDSKDFEGKRNSRRQKSAENVIRVENGIPAIITTEKFEQVQQKMSVNKGKTGSYSAKEMYLLSGLIVCGECLTNCGKDYAMSGNRKFCGRNKLKYVSYRCGNRDRTKECKNTELRREHIESFVLDELNKNIFNEQSIPTIAQMLTEHNQKQKESKLGREEGIKKQIDAVERKIQNLINAVAEGMTHTTALTSLQNLEADKARLEADIQQIHTTKEKAVVSEEHLKQLLFALQTHFAKHDLVEIKKFISNYVDKVIVYKDYVDVVFKLNVVGLNDGGEGI
jgi:site-specific DNA recombinase